jgi:hypothetical protein
MAHFKKLAGMRLMANGDLPGHPFRGNQHTDEAGGGAGPSRNNYDRNQSFEDAAKERERHAALGEPKTSKVFEKMAKMRTDLADVTVQSPPKQTSTKIAARDVTFQESGGGTAPKDKTERGNYWFDSAPGSLGDHSNKGATFRVQGQFGAALQKAKQQAAAWGHNQLRVAP